MLLTCKNCSFKNPDFSIETRSIHAASLSIQFPAPPSAWDAAVTQWRKKWSFGRSFGMRSLLIKWHHLKHTLSAPAPYPRILLTFNRDPIRRPGRVTPALEDRGTEEWTDRPENLPRPQDSLGSFSQNVKLLGLPKLTFQLFIKENIIKLFRIPFQNLSSNCNYFFKRLLVCKLPKVQTQH